MDGIGNDLWVCAGCRSINKLRAKQCYNCRTPRDRAAVDPRTIDPSTSGALREIDLPEFESPRPYALAAMVLILAITGMQVIGTILSARLVLTILGGGMPTDGDLVGVGLFGLVTLAVGILALAAWAAWLSKSVTAMPALGLGYPPGNGLTAFVESFVPGLNLFRVPAIVRDIVRRLSPEEGRGDAFIFVAWIGLFGGLFVPRVGRWFGFFTADTVEATLRNELIVDAISVTLVLIGAIFLVALIWWIQERIEERRAVQLGEVAAPGSDAAAAMPGDAPAPAPAPAAVPVAAPSDPSGTPLPPIARPEAGPAATEPVAGLAASSPDTAEPLAAVEPGPAAVDAARPAPAAAPPPAVSAPPAAVDVPPPAASAPPPPRPLTAVAPRVPDPSGPRLTIRIADGTMTGAVDDEAEEPLDLDELRSAAPALARAGGSAVVVAAPADADLAGRVVDLLRSSGVQPEIRSL